MSKPFRDMTLDELKLERDHWQNKIDHADGWGASLAAAMEFLEDCEMWIRRREAEGDKREV